MEGPESHDDEEDVRSPSKLLAGESAVLDAGDFSGGKELVVLGADDRIIAKIRRNAEGNPTDTGRKESYTAEFADGYLVLIPLPCYFSSHNMSAFSTFAELDEDAFGFGLPISGPGAQSFDVDVNSDYFRIVNSSEGEESFNFSESAAAGVPEESEIRQVEAGSEGMISGTINGGRKFCAATYRELGMSKYGICNEDSMGVNKRNGRMALADGMGGYGYGDQVSHFAVRELLSSGFSNLKAGLQDACDKYRVFTRLFDSRTRPNATIAAVEVKGNRGLAVCLGDCRFLHIRNGKCINMSIPRNFAWQLYMEGLVSYVSTFSSPQRSVVTTTLLDASLADYVELSLEKGDRLVAYDDGIALSEAEIAEIASKNDPDEAVRQIIAKTEERNRAGTFEVIVGEAVLEPVTNPGEGITANAPRDNASVIVYAH